MRIGGRIVIGLGAGLVLAAAVATQMTGQPIDQRVYDCGLSTPGNQVLATIELPRARDLWQRLPAAGGAPELENDRPALLVLFRGNYTWFRTGEVFQNVVCVYQDGRPNIYPDVNLAGANLRP
jgi:hypothetical protein